MNQSLTKCAIALRVVTLLLTTFTVAQTSYIHNQSSKDSEDISCPESQNILPCICFTNEESEVKFDCSDVEDEDHLKEIFNQDFSSNEFDELLIVCEGNNFVEKLKEGDLGKASFKTIVIRYCGTTEVDGIFKEKESLNVLDLSFNKLTTLANNSIELHGDNANLSLANNNITELSPASISGVSGVFDVHSNSLTELEEEVFRPAAEADATLLLEDNPFECGCDIAWLIINPDLLEKVSDTPSCTNGTKFVDLDPGYYKDNC